ncbi:hypothetical protein [Actinoplanes sp. NBRC 103695]|uniref:hypothetical protein n=1 Tax=Actinoplanes sp. NBRC 103695 TaxID=3032202 RepID=UPI002552BD99|nr:hypothetical protein [Actinoplanes sp. NBRC 103695]
MSRTKPYAQDVRDAAVACRDSAADVGDRLRGLRARLASLDAVRLGMPDARLADLLAGFDIYARMLDDALCDIAGDLRVAAGSPRRCGLELAAGSPG